MTADQVEICIQARLCQGNGYHSVGDLLSYRSMLWIVNGLYLDVSRNGERELYYILRAKPAVPDSTASAPQVR